jgi:hypothetical protein
MARRRRNSIERNGRAKRAIARRGSPLCAAARPAAVALVPNLYPDPTAPLEIADEIGNYIKLDTDFSLFSYAARA